MATDTSPARQHRSTCLLNPLCPLTTAKVLDLKAIALLLQTLLFLDISAGLVLGALRGHLDPGETPE